MKRSAWALLSNEAQYRVCLEAGVDFQRTGILCDNEGFHDFLKAKKLPFEALDEFLIQAEWESSNRWGCEKALDWTRHCRRHRVFDGTDFSSVLYYPFSRLLIQVAKNDAYARYIFNRWDPSSMVLFEPAVMPAFPTYSSNNLLNALLRERCSSQARPVNLLRVSEGTREPALTRYYPKLVERLLGLVKQVFRALNRKQKIDAVEKPMLAFGSIRHLAPVLRALRRQGANVVLYGTEFNFEQWNFARRNGIIYECSAPAGKAPTDPDFIRRHAAVILAALESATSSGLFAYENRDFSGLIREHLFHSMDECLGAYARQSAEYERLTRAYSFSGVITEDDYASRGAFFAGYFQARNVPVFCLSHAGVVFDFAVPEQNRVFGQSITFVNSEFEKDSYARRGWDPARIQVTGTPRYDALFLLRNRRPEPRGPLKLLYCVNTYILPVSPDRQSYLGSDVFCYRNVILPANEALLEASRGLPVRLTIKPHSIEGISVWKRYFEAVRTSVSVRVTDRQSKMFDLISRSDVMALYYWSTAMIESAILGVPTILIDIKKRNSKLVADFEAKGLCCLVSGVDELRKALLEIRQNTRAPERTPAQEYYLGLSDGRNTERVVNAILSHRPATLARAPQVSEALSTK